MVAWLFIGYILVPDILNPIWETDVVSRTILVIAVFGGCYSAEVIRGGLQSVNSGQLEAATALGLSNVQTKLSIELPNAIRTTMPTIVNLFIGLWKDTTLLYLMGVHELFNLTVIAITQQKEFIGLSRETLLFAGMVFWVVSFYLSRISLRIEAGLGLGYEGGGEAT
jgi:general L-amino acid transport system permease protein